MNDFDKKHLWHPYTSLKNPLPCYQVKSAQGSFITLNSGERLIDGMSSWWSAIHGYNHPVLNRAAQIQLEQMSHVMFGGLTHEPAIELGKLLLDIVPQSLDKIFYADSGSVAVEVAMKMAVQFWRGQDLANKTKFLSVKKGYHGDTLSAMSVSDPDTGMHDEFKEYIPKQYFAPAPPAGFKRSFQENDLGELRQLLEREHEKLAALIIEPIVQGAGGMRFYSPSYLEALVKLVREYDLLVIFDEIATGFGRTGELFASRHITLEPDILCIGKALSAGYLSFAATLCNQKVADGINAHHDGTFMHGPTFMANPLACAIAKASVKLLIEQDWQSNIKRIEKVLSSQLLKLAEHPKVADARVLGAIGVLELKQPLDLQSTQAFFVKHGVWLRPFGRLLYTMPPYIISDDALTHMCTAIAKWLDSSTN